MAGSARRCGSDTDGNPGNPLPATRAVPLAMGTRAAAISGDSAAQQSRGRNDVTVLESVGKQIHPRPRAAWPPRSRGHVQRQSAGTGGAVVRGEMMVVLRAWQAEPTGPRGPAATLAAGKYAVQRQSAGTGGAVVKGEK